MPGLSRTCRSSGLVASGAVVSTTDSYLCGILLDIGGKAITTVTISDGADSVLLYLTLSPLLEGDTKYVPFPFPIIAKDGIKVAMTGDGNERCIVYYQLY